MRVKRISRRKWKVISTQSSNSRPVMSLRKADQASLSLVSLLRFCFFNISIELWDHDVGKDESLGHVVFDIRWDYYLKARFLLVYQPFLSLDLCTVERKYNSSGILSMMQREAQYR